MVFDRHRRGFQYRAVSGRGQIARQAGRNLRLDGKMRGGRTWGARRDGLREPTGSKSFTPIP